MVESLIILLKRDAEVVGIPNLDWGSLIEHLKQKEEEEKGLGEWDMKKISLEELRIVLEKGLSPKKGPNININD